MNHPDSIRSQEYGIIDTQGIVGPRCKQALLELGIELLYGEIIIRSINDLARLYQWPPTPISGA
jgi:hypothetical protein